jgi:hypothetical protein
MNLRPMNVRPTGEAQGERRHTAGALAAVSDLHHGATVKVKSPSDTWLSTETARQTTL